MSMIQKICNIDGLGRLVIPKSMRREMSIAENDAVEVVYSDNGIITIKKVFDSCVFCNSEEALKTLKGKCICKSCLEALNK